MGGLTIQLVIMAVFGIACAMIASNRGRSAVAWFFIGIFLGCIGLIILLVLPDLKAEAEKHESLRRSNRRLRERLRKDRQVADQRHGDVQARIGVHDEALGIDTSRAVGAPEEARLESGAAPPPPPPGRKRWYYLVGEDRTGPITDAQLKKLWDTGEIGPATLVWNETMKDWKAIKDIAGLEAKLDA